MKLEIKRLQEDTQLPVRSTAGAAGLDLFASSYNYDSKNGIYSYHTGISVGIPSGYFGMLVPRSSIVNRGLILANSVGVIDSDYRGELLVKFHVIGLSSNCNPYTPGKRIAQLIILPYIQGIDIVEVETLDVTSRGDGGFGSTGV